MVHVGSRLETALMGCTVALVRKARFSKGGRRFHADPFDHVLIMSRELVLKMSMSIDGFVAGPKGELDWIFRTSNEESRAWLIDLMGKAGLHAMGRRSYLDMASFWPTSTLPMARPMNEIPKAVFSRSGKISRPTAEMTTAALNDAITAETEGHAAAEQAVLESWQNPLVAGTDLISDIQGLKQGMVNRSSLMAALRSRPVSSPPTWSTGSSSSCIRLSLVKVFRSLQRSIIGSI